LRHELHLQFAGQHLPLGLGVETNVADDGLAQQLRPDELADPLPGAAVSLAITVRSRLFWRTISSITRSGVPTAMKPPIIRLAPSGIIATDWSREGKSSHVCPNLPAQQFAQFTHRPRLGHLATRANRSH
jgi:hypothetical protein